MILDVVTETLRRQNDSILDVAISPVTVYQANGDLSTKTTTFHVEFVSYEKTLTDDDVNPLMEQVAIFAAQACGAERI